MAEYMLKEMTRSLGLEHRFYIDSAGTSEEITAREIFGEAADKLRSMNIQVEKHLARRMLWEDYDRFDLLIGMDKSTVKKMLELTVSDPHDKIRLLMDFAGEQGDIPDPWESGDFDQTCTKLQRGLFGLLNEIGSV